MNALNLVVDRRGTARWGGLRLPCSIGRGGIVDRKCEGDGGSPVGAWKITQVCFRADRVAPPQTALPTRPISPWDGWSDDPHDPLYNGPVRRPHGFGHERMRRADRLYDIVCVLDHNAARVPGQGSAIFLHLWRRPRIATEGCIALSRPDLLRVLKRWDPVRSRLVIAF